MSRRMIGAILGFAGVLVVLYVLLRPETSPQGSPPHVVVIVIDSLRYDRVGELTPHLDAFAVDAVSYENAYTTASSTAAAHASFLTSRYVSEHGLLTWNALPDSAVTLPEVLKDHGYQTHADVNLKLLSKQNLGQGVQHKNEGKRAGRKIVRRAVEIVEADHNKPFFMWLHLYDAHRPYGGESCETATRFSDRTDCDVGATNAHYNIWMDGAERNVCLHSVSARGLVPDDVEFIESRYDAGVVFTDEILAPLYEALSQREDTLVIVTADHGETLSDHPECMFTHDPVLDPAVTHVPLVVRYPNDRTYGHTDSLVSLVDLAPTILAVAGIEAPDSFHGRDIRVEPDAGRVVFSEAWTWMKSRSARTLHTQLIEETDSKKKRWLGSPDDTLITALDSLGQGELTDLDEETVELLESLGYLE